MNIIYRYIPDVKDIAVGDDFIWYQSLKTQAYAQIHRTSRNYYIVTLCCVMRMHMYTQNFSSSKDAFNYVMDWFNDIHKRL